MGVGHFILRFDTMWLTPFIIAIVIASLAAFWLLRKPKVTENRKEAKPTQQERELPASTPIVDQASSPADQPASSVSKEEQFSFSETSYALPSITILYGTQKGTAERFSHILEKQAQEKGWGSVTVTDLEEYDFDALSSEELVIFIVATYIEGTPTDSTRNFYKYLKGEANSLRAGNECRSVNYAVFGLCNSLYSEHYNIVGKNMDKWMSKMGANRVIKLGEGDENNDQDKAFTAWTKKFWILMEQSEKEIRENMKNNTADDDTVYSDEEPDSTAEPLLDIEDIGDQLPKKKKPQIKKRKKKSQKIDAPAVDSDSDSDEEYDPTKPMKEMLSSTHKLTLQKQGYKIIGSHSGVKLCRWTKSMLRGRGGCYKHTFYGIASHRCMEMTPSMACANKCVFCWRHHKNPVTREWRWVTDGADMIIDGAIERHRKMIKTCRGIPGVIPERFEEGFNIRHCALSLVGEPIIYPEINNFIQLLHSKGISSFMVTNAQFPDKIEELVPVTQLYVSIDAPTEESLKKIDRPLFTDFWQRFLDSIAALSRKGQRTVFRLTLVKDWNMDEIDRYAELLAIGKPDFIEVKGVTYAGGGKKNQLSMSNVPWHTEVIRFCEALGESAVSMSTNGSIPRYEIASEHEHSCCVLLANVDKFKVNGKWHTFIDFDKFLELQASGESFSAVDYMEETPEWAVFGHSARGFDPDENRFRKVRNHPNKEVEEPKAPIEEYAIGGC